MVWKQYLSEVVKSGMSFVMTSIPHDLLKSRISNLVHNAFRKKDGSVRYTHIKLTRAKGYFTHDINGGGDNMFTADSICEMIEFLIDNILKQTTLTQSGAPGRVIGWTNFSH